MANRIATYARVSTADQVETGTSLADQERRLRAAVTARAGLLVAHFADAGVSGSLQARPGLDALRRTVADRGVDVVMATKIDRVSRSAIGLLDLIEDLRAHNCHLVLIDEGLDTSTSAGDLTSGLLGVIGGWERRRIAERTTAGRRAAAEIDGRFVGSTPPFGYTTALAPTGRGKQLVIDPQQAQAVRAMYQLVVHDGLTLTAAAEELNHAGLPAPAGNPWTAVTLGRWMAREPPIRAASGTWRFDGIDVPIPPILTPSETALWRAWQTERHRTPHPRGPYLLSGVLYMACGRHAMGRTAGRQRPTYSCRDHYLPQGDPNRHDSCRNVPADTVDDAVKAHLHQVLTHPGILTEAAHQRLDPTGAADALADLVERLASNDADLAAEARLFRAQGYTGTALAAVLAPLHEQRKTLLRDIAQARRTTAPPDNTTQAAQRLTPALVAGLRNATPQTWRDLITALSVEIRIEAYEPCSACAGTGYLPFPTGGSPRRWPTKCATCLRGTLPALTIELDDITATTLAHDAQTAEERVLPRPLGPAQPEGLSR